MDVPGPPPAPTLRRRPWSPPQVLDGRARTILRALVVFALVAGYQGTLLASTITFAGNEFGASSTDNSRALALIRLDILLTIPLTVLADRIGRRRVLLAVTGGGLVGALGCALVPSLGALTGGQLVTRGLVTASALIITVLVVEEMPAGARAFGGMMIVAAAAVGSGLSLGVAAFGDAHVRAWRVAFVVPVLAAPLLARAAKRLPESKRFVALTHRQAVVDRSLRGHGRRLAILCAGSFLLTLFANPASQLLGDFLRRERGFSSAEISAFRVATNVPGIAGMLVGGRVADVRGRRAVLAVGLLGNGLMSVAVYNTRGAAMVAAALAQSLVAAAALPVLAVYGPELFPTAVRNRANALTTAAARVGGASGLLLAGWIGRDDNLARGMTVLGLAPLALAALVLVAYPETARRELEAINPEDQADAAELSSDSTQAADSSATWSSRLLSS